MAKELAMVERTEGQASSRDIKAAFRPASKIHTFVHKVKNATLNLNRLNRSSPV
jgi:hypothetical protein